MRAVIQRVLRASVVIREPGAAAREDLEAHGGEAKIGVGLVVLVGVGPADGPDDADRLAGKIVALRIFEDGEGKMNLSLADVGGSMLAVSQFTLLAESWKGNRPSFTAAAPPEAARVLFQRFVETARARGIAVETGVFGARMEVEIVNDGPVTILLDTREGKR